LMVFAGTAAILNMGGPITEICAGRIDSANGSLSEVLGPGPLAPNCSVQGDCPAPLGADTIGLIYVNPEGFMGIPDPVLSAPQIREVFGRMDMDDRETVALIGGGHAFGKTHGACPEGAGDPPSEAPDNPWPGMCGTGRGVDTFTSGFEGPWTSNPLRWDNQFFQLLADEVFVVDIGPGGKHQWRIDNPMNEADADLMMLTSDLALVYDSNYSSLVTEFAADQNALDIAFSNAWAKLTTDGGVWADAKKCINGTQA
jgi:catalase (peroxidase I)